MLAPAELWPAYLDLLDTAPLTTKALTACTIIGSADCFAQLLEKRNTEEEFDAMRALRWAVFGLVLQGPWNHFFYLLLDGALPPTPDPFTITTLEKVGIDQFIQAPIFTVIILIFFSIVEGKGYAFAKSDPERPRRHSAQELGRLPPRHGDQHWLLPAGLRVLFLNCVFFCWVVYLALPQREGGGVSEDQAAAVARWHGHRSTLRAR